MVVDRFPGIRAVALEIAYDNGMINRNQSEEDWLRSLDPILGADGVYEEDLRSVSDWCLTLTEDERQILAAGEHSEMEALQQTFTRPELLGIFNGEQA